MSSVAHKDEPASAWFSWSNIEDGLNKAKDFAAQQVETARNSDLARKASDVASKASDLQSKVSDVWKQVSDSETSQTVNSLIGSLFGAEENRAEEAEGSKAVGWPVPPQDSEEKSLKSKALSVINNGAHTTLDGINGAIEVLGGVGRASKSIAEDVLDGVTKTSRNTFRTVNALTGAVATTAETIEDTVQFANNNSLLSWLSTAYVANYVAQATFWFVAAGGIVVGGGNMVGRIVHNALPPLYPQIGY